MAGTQTEALHEAAKGRDERPRVEIASLLAEGQIRAATSLREALDGIAGGSAAMAKSIREGGALHYVAAGSSGLMAAADAQELGGTFSIPTHQIFIHMAGGLPTGPEMPGDTEDEIGDLEQSLSGLSSKDTVIAVSASGTTPYTMAAVELAKAKGAAIIAIANNPNVPLFEKADYEICLATPPEVLSGSTRMGAGTAQKIALNMLSTLMAVDLGHVHDGMMVNVRADNAKLQARAAGIVSQIAGVDQAHANSALKQAEGDVKPAILIAAKGIPSDAARDVLGETNGNLRAALARLT